MDTLVGLTEDLRKLRETYGEQEVIDYLAISRGTLFNYLRKADKKISWHMATLIKLGLEGEFKSLRDAKDHIKKALDVGYIKETEHRFSELEYLTKCTKELKSRVKYLESDSKIINDLNECKLSLQNSIDQQKQFSIHIHRLHQLLEDARLSNLAMIKKLEQQEREAEGKTSL